MEANAIERSRQLWDCLVAEGWGLCTGEIELLVEISIGFDKMEGDFCVANITHQLRQHLRCFVNIQSSTAIVIHLLNRGKLLRILEIYGK